MKSLRSLADWGLLLVLSAVFSLLLQAARLPAALLLGPMAAAIMVQAIERAPRLPGALVATAQGVIGCMIARYVTGTIVGAIFRDWPLYVGCIFALLLISSVIGWQLARWRILPGSAALWGSSPGAATAMTVMAEAYGADVRLVAFMQYLRVVMVALVASLMARFWGVPSDQPAAIGIFAPVALLPFLETAALAGWGALAGSLLRLPAGTLLLPLVVGAALNATGAMTITLPRWLLIGSYAVVGWSIGLRFNRAVMLHVARAFPRVLLSTLILIAASGLVGVLLIYGAGIDPMTAFLATCPGGADAVAIVAAASQVDLPFVMAMQTARLLIVLASGPILARYFLSRLK